MLSSHIPDIVVAVVVVIAVVLFIILSRTRRKLHRYDEEIVAIRQRMEVNDQLTAVATKVNSDQVLNLIRVRHPVTPGAIAELQKKTKDQGYH